MARVIAARTNWSRALQSDLEARVLAEIRRQGLPEPEIQYTLELRGGGRIRFDFAWSLRRVGLEVDHPFWHAGEGQSHRDKRRDRLVAAQNWRTVRLASLDVTTGLAEAITEVASILGLDVPCA